MRPLSGLLRASLLAVLLASCGTSRAPSETNTPAPSVSVSRSTPTPDSPRDSSDLVLLNYCLAEEHIVGIETRLLDKPPAQAARDLREAQTIAYDQASALAGADRFEQARAVRTWGGAFDRSIALMRRGADPFDALMPATRALGKVGLLIDCEVDA